MKQLLLKSIAFFCFLIGTTNVLSQPYFVDNFENYADGTGLSGSNPFGAAGNTKASTEQSFSGTTSAKMEIFPHNNGGFGNWGGYIAINPTISKGGEIWVRLAVYWPSSFEFSATPFMKFLRLHNKQGDGSNGGYNDLYVDNADDTNSVLRCIKEVHNIWEVYDGNPIPRDTWETYEMYLFVDDVTVDDGGNARMRIWRDNELIFERTDVPTITDAGGVIDYFYLFTYWNNENPPQNYLYVDDLIIFTQTNPPTEIDANGNAYIGNYNTLGLGINEENFNNSISISPNPTTNIFTINLQNETLEKAVIYNQLGQQVKRLSSQNEELIENQVDISNLSNGIYFVTITSESGKMTTKKIVKN